MQQESSVSLRYVIETLKTSHDVKRTFSNPESLDFMLRKCVTPILPVPFPSLVF